MAVQIDLIGFMLCSCRCKFMGLGNGMEDAN